MEVLSQSCFARPRLLVEQADRQDGLWGIPGLTAVSHPSFESEEKYSPPAQGAATAVIEPGHAYFMVLMIFSFFSFNWTNKMHIQ